MKIVQNILLVVCLAATTTWSQAVPESGDLAPVFRKMLTERLNSAARGDARTYGQFIAPDAVFVDDYGIEETASQHLATIGHRPVGRSRYTLDSLKVDRKQEGFVVVTWAGAEHVMFGTREVHTGYRSVESWVERAGRWLMVSHAETQIIAPPEPLKIPAETLQDYVGKYEWWPGYVDTITREGDQLYSQGTGDMDRTLNRAATPESFYFEGEPNLVVFARDRSGRVSHYVLHWSDGHTTVARRLPSR